MSVSVVIPAINEESRLAGCVRSAIAAGADEVIVVDGGSEDRSVAAAEQAGARVVKSDPGRARQQNAGAAESTGDVLLFLHADCQLPLDAAEKIDLARRQGSRVGAFRQRIDAPQWRYRWLEWGNDRRVSWWGLAYGDQSIWLDRAFFQQLGGFPDEPLLEDLLLMKLARKIARPVLLDSRVHIDARRWQRYGVVRQTLRNWWILWRHRCGATPKQLATAYRRHDR